MSNAFDDDDFTLEDDWVEISDMEGHTASLRHLATIRFGEKVYSVLGAARDGDGEIGLMLVREEQTSDGASEYVMVGDEQEAEQVVGRFVAQIVMERLLDEHPFDDGEYADCETDGVEACGYRHRAGEFCFCDDPQYLQ